MRRGISGAILVGGNSRRMGTDKALVDVGGLPIIQRVADVLRLVSDDVWLIGKGAAKYAWLGLRSADDLVPSGGPLAGIYTALRSARFSHCIVVACDMPFLNPRLLRYMARAARGWDTLVPRVDGHLEPLHGVYSRACLGPLEDMLRTGQLCPLDLYPLVRTAYLESETIARLDPGYRSFINLNTPEDLVQAVVTGSPVHSRFQRNPAPTNVTTVLAETQ